MGSGREEPRAFTDTPQFKVMRAVMGAATPVVRTVLASRFAGPLGRNLLLLRFRGRRSGTWRTTPVGYVRTGDRVVLVTSPTYRWWRNIDGPTRVQVRVAGQWHEATARLLHPDDPEYDAAVAIQVAGRGPGMLRGFGIPVTDDGRVPDDARADATKHAHIVVVELGAAIARPA